MHTRKSHWVGGGSFRASGQHNNRCAEGKAENSSQRLVLTSTLQSEMLAYQGEWGLGA